MCSFTASGYLSLNSSEKILVDGDIDGDDDLDDELGDGVDFFLRRVGILDPACVELN